VLLGWILAWARFYAYLHDVTSPKGLQVNLEQDCQVSELSSYRAVLNSSFVTTKTTKIMAPAENLTRRPSLLSLILAPLEEFPRTGLGSRILPGVIPRI
jgi:hypothetical protein